MFLHIIRAQARSMFGRRLYQLSASLEATPDEIEIIHSHRIDRLECFYDRYRDTLLDQAEEASDNARAVKLFPATLMDVFVVWTEALHSVYLTYRAATAFKITVGDLIQPGGVTIIHRSLSEILLVERAITASVKPIIAAVEAASSFEAETEFIMAPDGDRDETKPSDWPDIWRS